MDLADLAWLAGRLVASEPTPRCQLLRLLAARAYRAAAWRRLIDAIRFEAVAATYPWPAMSRTRSGDNASDHCRELAANYLQTAIELEFLALSIERGRRPWEQSLRDALQRPA